MLLEHHANPNLRDEQASLLSLVVTLGDMRAVELLLNHGARIDLLSLRSALSTWTLAVRDIFSVLLTHKNGICNTVGIDHLIDDERNVLHLAILFNGAEAAQELLCKFQANPSIPDRAQDSPVHLALRHGDEAAAKYIRLLQKHGASLGSTNAKGQTPFQLAVLSRRTSVVQAFLECGLCTNDYEFRRLNNDIEKYAATAPHRMDDMDASDDELVLSFLKSQFCKTTNDLLGLY
jgi:ankyrin repeat protein